MPVVVGEKPCYDKPQNAELSANTQPQTIPLTPEKEQEDILKQKYPNVARSPGSQMLLKRLKSKNTKFFDSADYSAAQVFNQKPNAAEPQASPEREPARIAASRNTIASLPLHPLSQPEDEDVLVATGTQIPKPDTVPTRKTSNMASLMDSKLSPPSLTQPSPLSSPMAEKSPGLMFK